MHQRLKLQTWENKHCRTLMALLKIRKYVKWDQPKTYPSPTRPKTESILSNSMKLYNYKVEIGIETSTHHLLRKEVLFVLLLDKDSVSLLVRQLRLCKLDGRAGRYPLSVSFTMRCTLYSGYIVQKNWNFQPFAPPSSVSLRVPVPVKVVHSLFSVH